MRLLLKSSYLLLWECRIPSPIVAKQFLSIHSGLIADSSFQSCICLSQNDTVLELEDSIFVEMRKYFGEMDRFFRDKDSSTFTPIRISNVVIEPSEVGKVLLVKQYKLVENIIQLDCNTWQQIMRLRDVLCLQLTILRKYRIYAKLVFDRLVNHLASFDSSEVNVLHLPMDMIYEHKYLKLNIEHYDVHMCQLVDAEIRAFMSDQIQASAQNLQETKSITFTSFYPFL